MSDFRLGEFLVQPSLNRLSRGGTVSHVRPQVMDVLVSIARGSGRPVSKEQILEEVWPGLYVVDSAVSRCVGEVRELFGDDPKSPKYIQNIPKRGYRLLLPVEFVPRPEAVADGGREGLPAGGASPVEGSAGSESLSEMAAGAVESTVPGALTRMVAPAGASPPSDLDPTPTDVERQASGAVRGVTAGGVARDPWRAGAAGRRSPWRWLALVAAVGVAAVAGLLFGPWKPSPALGMRDTIVIADFANRTGDPTFDEGLKIALAVQLEQSPHLQVVSSSQVRDALRFMRVDPSSRLTPALARDVARREGITAVVEGSIARLGERYAVGLEVTGTSSGEVLARELVEAEGQDAVLDALGRAVRRLRPRLGESLATVERFDAPVARATTSSFEALRAYSQAERLREQSSADTDERAALLYEHAIELDPGFAVAHAKLARVVRMRGDALRAAALATRAYELRERASEAERFYILAHYYEDAINDRAKAFENYETWKRTYPRAWVPWYVLSSTYLMRGQFREALEHAERAVELAPQDVRLLTGLAGAYNVTGRYDETRRVLDRARQRNAEDVGVLSEFFDLAAATADRALLATVVAEWPADAPSRSRLALNLGGLAAGQGSVAESRRRFAEAVAVARDAGDREAETVAHVVQALAEGLRGNRVEAEAAAARAAAAPRNTVDVAIAAAAVALGGSTAESRALLARVVPGSPGGRTEMWVGVARAAIALNEGRPAEALTALEPNRSRELGVIYGLVPLMTRARAHLAAGQYADAVAAFEQVLAARAVTPAVSQFPLAHLGLARAHRAAGAPDKAREAYEAFLRACAGADPNEPHLMAARGELAALGAQPSR